MVCLTPLQRPGFSEDSIFCYATYSTSKTLRILKWKKAKRQSPTSAIHFWKKKSFSFSCSVTFCSRFFFLYKPILAKNQK